MSPWEKYPDLHLYDRAARNGTSFCARSCGCYCKCRMQARRGLGAKLAHIPCGSHLHWRHSPDLFKQPEKSVSEWPRGPKSREMEKPKAPKKPCDPEFPTHLGLAGWDRVLGPLAWLGSLGARSRKGPPQGRSVSTGFLELPAGSVLRWWTMVQWY